MLWSKFVRTVGIITVLFDLNFIYIQWTLVTTIAFFPKDIAIKMNLLFYRILNKQIDK